MRNQHRKRNTFGRSETKLSRPLDAVAWDSQHGSLQRLQSLLRVCLALCSSKPVQPPRLTHVPTHALPILVHDAETALGNGEPLVGRLAEQLQSLAVVYSNSLTIQIQHAEVGLGSSVALVGSKAVQLQCLAMINCNSQPFLVHVPELALASRVALIRSLPKHLQSLAVVLRNTFPVEELVTEFELRLCAGSVRSSTQPLDLHRRRPRLHSHSQRLLKPKGHPHLLQLLRAQPRQHRHTRDAVLRHDLGKQPAKRKRSQDDTTGRFHRKVLFPAAGLVDDVGHVALDPLLHRRRRGGGGEGQGGHRRARIHSGRRRCCVGLEDGVDRLRRHLAQHNHVHVLGQRRQPPHQPESATNIQNSEAGAQPHLKKTAIHLAFSHARASSTTNVELGGRRSSFSFRNRLSRRMSRPLCTISLKMVPRFPNCFSATPSSVVVDEKDTQHTWFPSTYCLLSSSTRFPSPRKLSQLTDCSFSSPPISQNE
mmetsp:Transcript_71148/g.189926  ORF Transcript_71148/g.189926 Transcript_71148/m.189926 type:complete len:481 (+) Transcript_71148:207-1649(+)